MSIAPSRRSAPRQLLLHVGLICVVGLGGCDGDSAELKSDPDHATNSSSAPEIEPADGLALQVKNALVHVPQGWEQDDGILPSTKSAGKGLSQVVVSGYGGSNYDDLDTQVRYKFKHDPTVLADAERTDDVDFDGVAGWAIEGRDSTATYQYLWGTQAHGRDIEIALILDLDIAPDRRDEIAQSVLDSFEWTDD